MKRNYHFSEFYHGPCSVNDPMGSSSDHYPKISPMDSSIHQLIATINTYQRLLHRYVSFIVKNKLVASLIVDKVLFLYSSQVKFIESKDIRKYLQQNVRECCQQWQRSKSKTLYLSKPKNPT